MLQYLFDSIFKLFCDINVIYCQNLLHLKDKICYSMKKLLLIVAVFLWSGLQIAIAQSRPVKGQILDEKGEGVPGASVLVKGTTAGTITDADGNFSLEVPDDKKELIIKAIGYSDQEVPAGDGDNVLDIRLHTNTTQLTET